ncbi:hypothetical protein [Limosilactobacillus reuteri]|uniref:hypothetical protein n=1 Tax=Limosilactobacillus reuteri TaxID=1598 RepID=UPI000F03216F|nr:hypothetical protein [Limosilactobacillus reuteri]RMX26181.1 hypothetical protein C6H63_08515 [Limosilactobacillus reuteri]
MLVKNDELGRLWFFDKNKVLTKQSSLPTLKTNLVYEFTPTDKTEILPLGMSTLKKVSLGNAPMDELNDLFKRFEMKYGNLLKDKEIKETPFVQGPYFSACYGKNIFMEESLPRLFIMYYIKKYIIHNACAVLLTDFDKISWNLAIQKETLEREQKIYHTSEYDFYFFQNKYFLKVFPSEASLANFKFSIHEGFDYFNNRIMFNSYLSGNYNYKLIHLFGKKKVIVITRKGYQ